MLDSHFKTSLRALAKNKTYAGLNIIGLALGLTCSLLIFLFVEFHLSTDKYHEHADQIYQVVLDIHSKDGTVDHEAGVAIAIPNALKEHFASVKQTASMMLLTNPTITVNRSADQKESFVEKTGVAYATTGLLEMFYFEFTAGDKRSALQNPGSVVLTERQARKYFGTIEVLGKSIRINNSIDLKITGIIRNLPENTDLKADVLISLPTLKIINPTYELSNLTWIGSSHFGFIQLPEQYNFKNLDSQLPGFVDKYLGRENYSHWRFRLLPLSEMHFDERYGGQIRKPLLWTLCLVGAFLLIIASINCINLSTAQALKRAKEVGVRKVLGGSKQQIFWQFIIEAGCITLLSTLLALVSTVIFLPTLNEWINIPLLINPFNPTLFVFLAGIMLLVILLAGGYPAAVLASLSPILVMKKNITTQTKGSFSIRRALVIFQLILSQVLMIGALVIISQVHYFRKADMGFIQDAIVRVKVPVYSKSKLEAFRSYLGQNPAIQTVSFHGLPPADNNDNNGYVKFNNRGEWEPFLVQDRWADSQYLHLYGLKLIAGRNIIEKDSVIEFIVNQEFVQRLGITNPEEVIGKPLVNGNTQIEGRIVGVVKNFHNKSLQNPIEPCVIYPFLSMCKWAGIQLHTGHLPQTLQSIEQAWRSVFSDPVFEYEFVDERIAKLYQKEETISELIQLFTIVAIALCCLGFYGLVSFMAVQRFKEISIRKVLGASVGDIVWLFGKEFFALTLISFLVAAPIADLVMNQWLQGFAYRVSLEWWIFTLTGLLTLFIVLLTIGWQSIKVALINPVKSLSSE